jgi:Cu(I)/Ag(I) efflux system membrane fusion protein
MSEERVERLRRFAPLILVGLLALGAVGAGGYWLGANRGAAPTAEGGRAVLYYYDPMRSGRSISTSPANRRSWIWQLVPRYEGDAGGEAGVSYRAGRCAESRCAIWRLVERSGQFQRTAFTAAGVIAFNERNLAVVQARRWRLRRAQLMAGRLAMWSRAGAPHRRCPRTGMGRRAG